MTTIREASPLGPTEIRPDGTLATFRPQCLASRAPHHPRPEQVTGTRQTGGDAVMKSLSRRAIRAGVGLTGVALAIWPGSRGRKALRSGGDQMARNLRNWSGWWQGASYRLAGRRPDPAVSDDVLADRIRSTIGPLERHLDVPRVHVMVEDHVALLHGDVGTAEEADQIEQAVQAVSGVAAVESYLHLGLLRGDARPSEGCHEQRVSDARKRLLAAAVRAGVAQEQAPVVVRAVLGRFSERLPHGEREHVLGHLPADVRAMLDAPKRLGHPRRVRSLADLVFLLLLSTDALDPATAAEVVRSVVGELRRLVPEEAADVAAVLPADLRAFWETATTG